LNVTLSSPIFCPASIPECIFEVDSGPFLVTKDVYAAGKVVEGPAFEAEVINPVSTGVALCRTTSPLLEANAVMITNQALKNG
jgi:hypothetical protein